MSSAEIHIQAPHDLEPDDKPSAGPLDSAEPAIGADIAGSDQVRPDLKLVPDWRMSEKDRQEGKANAIAIRSTLAGAQEPSSSSAETEHSSSTLQLRTPNADDFDEHGNLKADYLKRAQ